MVAAPLWTVGSSVDATTGSVEGTAGILTGAGMVAVAGAVGAGGCKSAVAFWDSVVPTAEAVDGAATEAATVEAASLVMTTAVFLAEARSGAAPVFAAFAAEAAEALLLRLEGAAGLEAEAVVVGAAVAWLFDFERVRTMV